LLLLLLLLLTLLLLPLCHLVPPNLLALLPSFVLPPSLALLSLLPP
jgi:hypothetical protein